MHQFIKLPSGLIVNLSVVSQIVPVGEALEVHFTGSDKAVLKGEDAEAFRRKSGLGGPFLNILKMTIFWVVVIAAVVLVYLAIRSRG
jgi:hypothetical protein